MTTELEREILKVLDANNFGLSVYAKPGADGISRAEIMESMPTSIGAAGELAAEEVARTMGLSREEQEAEMRAQVPGIKGMATGAAVATATTIPDIIGLGYGGVKALLAKEGEKGQAFLDGLSSISGTVGSEKAGKIYAEYVGGLDATDEEKAAMMTGYQAGEFGGIPGLAGAYQLAKKGVKAAPDFIEGAGDAAKARMGGATLTSGVDPDPLIAAAGDAVAKFRAPTEKQPGVIAFHGSGADFDEFSLEKIGTGEGAQAYGYGLYFAEKEDIAKFYKDTVSEQAKKLSYDGKEDAAKAVQTNVPFTVEDDYRYYVFGDAEEVIDNALAVQRGEAPSESYVNNQLMAFDRDGALLIEMPDGTSLSLLKSLSGDTFTATPVASSQEGKMYKVGLEPKPEDMLDYQLPIAEQNPKFLKAFKEVYHDRIKSDPQLSKLYPTPDSLTMKDMGLFDKSIVGQAYNTFAKELFNGDEAALTQALLEKGVSGIKYRDAGSRGGAKSLKDASFNYVIFDDKMIKILEKYGIVGPVAITGVAASQQEGESDGRSA